MPSIDDLNLQNDETVAEINWEASERGTFSPRLEAGKDYLFTMELEDDPFGTREYDGKTIYSINYKATTTITTPEGEEKEVTVRFQSADFYKTPKMIEKRVNSDGEELMRALNLRLEGKLTWDNIKQAFREADGRAKFTATIGWKAYSKDDKINIRTHPRKNDILWPKGADGKYEPVVTFPSGEKATGREEVVRYRLPRQA